MKSLIHRVSPGHWISTASCIIAFLQSSGTSIHAQHFLPPVLNPFQLSNEVDYFNHNLVDIDADGDLDLLYVDYAEPYDVDLYFLENISLVDTPMFAAPQTIPMDLPFEPEYIYFDLGDIDDDGDLDIIGLVGYAYMKYSYDYEPVIAFIENAGSAMTAQFTLSKLDTLSSSIPVGGVGLPHLADIDNDGDLDLFFDMIMTVDEIHLVYYENTGLPTQYQFAQGILEPFNYEFPQDGQYMVHDFGDLDHDGDLDILAISAVYDSGSVAYLQNFAYYMNIGSPEIPQFASPLFDPFNLPDETALPSPCLPHLADWDRDGDLDLSCALYDIQGDNFVYYFQNTGTSGFNLDSDKIKLKVDIHPNPSLRYFEIFLDNSSAKNVEVKISDMHAHEMYARATSDGYLRVQCDDWPAGNYIVHVKSDEITAVRMVEVIR